MKNGFAIIFVVVAFALGIFFSPYVYQTAATELNSTYQPSTEGLVEIEPSINDTTIHLTGECYEITFDITPDQAYSIAKGMEGSMVERPLTHDIMKDIFDVFNIEVMQVRIDGYVNNIYSATMILRQGDRVLELDARPSDSIALAVRVHKPLYIEKAILESNGKYVC